MTSRRHFLRQSGVLAASLMMPLPVRSAFSQASFARSPQVLARDEDFWETIAAEYDLVEGITNLEGGYWGMMARPVLAAFKDHTDRVNRENSYYARTHFNREAGEIRERIAAMLGIEAGELAYSRNATEALQALISQYNALSAGETVMYADLDYPAMQQAMDELAQRKGAHVARLVIPEPATSEQQIVDAYAEALDAHPNTRLLLLTHANNKTGLIHPVRAITAMARARGIDVIVDAAHSWGHISLDIEGFGADYVGINLHKWIGAPLGVGAMIIRKAGLHKIDRAHGDPGSVDSIYSRLHTGTMNFATILTVPDALDFQESVGFENKYARIRYLRDLWVQEARAIDGVDILTPDVDSLVGAITSFRLNDERTRDGNRDLVRTLVDEHGVFTVARTGVDAGDCIRVTPALYNLPADLTKLVTALRDLAA